MSVKARPSGDRAAAARNAPAFSDWKGRQTGRHGLETRGGRWPSVDGSVAVNRRGISCLFRQFDMAPGDRLSDPETGRFTKGAIHVHGETPSGSVGSRRLPPGAGPRQRPSHIRRDLPGRKHRVLGEWEPYQGAIGSGRPTGPISADFISGRTRLLVWDGDAPFRQLLGQRQGGELQRGNKVERGRRAAGPRHQKDDRPRQNDRGATRHDLAEVCAGSPARRPGNLHVRRRIGGAVQLLAATTVNAPLRRYPAGSSRRIVAPSAARRSNVTVSSQPARLPA
jgi:hypothetical protein